MAKFTDEQIAAARRKISEDVAAFAVEMEKVMLFHVHSKGASYQYTDPSYLLPKLMEEVGDLAKAVCRNGRPEAIMHEAADIANMAMMIWAEGHRQMLMMQRREKHNAPTDY